MRERSAGGQSRRAAEGVPHRARIGHTIKIIESVCLRPRSTAVRAASAAAWRRRRGRAPTLRHECRRSP
eukprot:scaffold11342_cov114-Isochrysis_galbana.AAC.3